MGLDFDQLFPGRFIKAGEFNGKDVTLTIVSVELEPLPQDNGKDQMRGIVGFKETKKQLVLNRTNGECFKAMWGRDVDDWIGKRVTLWPAPYEGDIAIRVKGSPDLPEAKNFRVKIGRKNKQLMLLPTGKKQGQAAAETVNEVAITEEIK